MVVAVLGCGAIGGVLLGHLSQKRDVYGVVRSYQKEHLERVGLTIKEGPVEWKAKVKVGLKLKEPVDLAIFATKISNLEEVLEANEIFLKRAVALSTQNGLGAEKILGNYFPEEKIITSIVMFGATFYPPNRVVSNFGGSLILGNFFNREVSELARVEELLAGSFQVQVLKNIKGAKYLKLFINLNNCLAAILGKSMQESFSDLEISKLAIELNKEAYRIIEKSKIELASLPNYPKERIQSLVSMPSQEAAQIFSKVITGLSKEPLYGSVLQSIKRGRRSEIDYINGEVVRLAKEIGETAPLNERVVELVHGAEEGSFLSKDELLSNFNPGQVHL